MAEQKRAIVPYPLYFDAAGAPGRGGRAGPQTEGRGGARAPVDAVETGRPRPRPGGLFQDERRAQGRGEGQGGPRRQGEGRVTYMSCGVFRGSTSFFPADTLSTEWMTAPSSRTVASTRS